MNIHSELLCELKTFLYLKKYLHKWYLMGLYGNWMFNLYLVFLVCQWHVCFISTFPHLSSICVLVLHWFLFLFFTCLFSWSFWKRFCFIAETVVNLLRNPSYLWTLNPPASGFWLLGLQASHHSWFTMNFNFYLFTGQQMMLITVVICKGFLQIV